MDAQEWPVPLVLGCTSGMGTHPSKIFNLTQLQTDLLMVYEDIHQRSVCCCRSPDTPPTPIHRIKLIAVIILLPSLPLIYRLKNCSSWGPFLFLFFYCCIFIHIPISRTLKCLNHTCFKQAGIVQDILDRSLYRVAKLSDGLDFPPKINPWPLKETPQNCELSSRQRKKHLQRLRWKSPPSVEQSKSQKRRLLFIFLKSP